MAVTKIKQIYATDNRATEYITGAIKTDNGRLIDYYCCGNNPSEVAEHFGNIRNFGSNKVKILAQHIIQSFAPNEVTPEQALECGKLLADRLLKGEYQYVLATHIDKEHIHNHLIFCNVNMLNFKTFETNENRGKQSWKCVRQLSDDICRDYNLSVISQSELTGERGKSYFEWTQNSSNNSWKNKLKNIINYTVLESTNFNDFLSKMRLAGVECEYKPENKIRLKYKLKGQQKFTRAKTLGRPYDVEGISERIERAKKFFSGQNIRAENLGLINTNTDFMNDNEGLQHWAKVQNIKTIAEIMVKLEKLGIANIDELQVKVTGKIMAREDLLKQKNTVKKQRLGYENLANSVDIYRKTKPIFEELAELRTKVLNKHKAEAFANKHSTDLTAYHTKKQ
jgi:hypothetical protein